MKSCILIVVTSPLVLSLGLAIAAGGEPAAVRPPRQAAETMLRMSIAATKAGNANETPAFGVALENAGDKDAMLNLGIMLANGKTLLPEAIRLILIDSSGKSRELHFSDRRHPGVAGRVDDYIVPLRAGSTHTLKLSLDDYWCPETKEFQIKLKPGDYRIRARLASKGAQHLNADTEGIKLMHIWKGKLQTDATSFRIR